MGKEGGRMKTMDTENSDGRMMMKIRNTLGRFRRREEE
jgi:hypothetical protein